jgi:hypothetical protein
MHMPTGLAVIDHRLLVASSNADLFYDQATGGAILNLDAGHDPTFIPTTVQVTSAINVQSFAGEIAVARALPQTPGAPEADHCGVDIPGVRAVFATRGSNTLNLLSVDSATDPLPGRIRCLDCGIPSSGVYSDPFPVAIACTPGKARAFVGYLGAQNGSGWVTALDLVTGGVQTASVGSGVVRALAYDPLHDRLYTGGLATGSPTPLRWLELGGCTFGQGADAGGCSIGQATLPGVPTGAEIRSIALAHPFPGAPQRAFVTVRLYNVSAASLSGGRTSDYGGLLLVLDLVENSLGGVTPTLVRTVPEAGNLGAALQDVRVLPARPGQRDAVVVVSQGTGVVWLYDDDDGALTAFDGGRDPVTGAPLFGGLPGGVAVDPEPLGSVVRVWIGSYRDSFVTPIDVPLAAPGEARYAPEGVRHRITGGTP